MIFKGKFFLDMKIGRLVSMLLCTWAFLQVIQPSGCGACEASVLVAASLTPPAQAVTEAWIPSSSPSTGRARICAGSLGSEESWPVSPLKLWTFRTPRHRRRQRVGSARKRAQAGGLIPRWEGGVSDRHLWCMCALVFALRIRWTTWGRPGAQKNVGVVFKVGRDVGTAFVWLEAYKDQVQRPGSFLFQPLQGIQYFSQHRCPRSKSCAPWSWRHLGVEGEISAMIVIFIPKIKISSVNSSLGWAPQTSSVQPPLERGGKSLLLHTTTHQVAVTRRKEFIFLLLFLNSSLISALCLWQEKQSQE